MTSRFFAYLDRLRWIKRWGLKRNQIDENVMEHSWQVATIAHALALIGQHKFNVSINVDQVATVALYHDVSEIITGDLPTPVKYHSQTITQAYKAIESQAEKELVEMLPAFLQPHLSPYIQSEQIDETVHRLIKGADLISAWLKCQSELAAGNQEFSTALKDIEGRIRALNSQEVDYFMATFTDSYQLTLDELLEAHDPKAKPK